MWRATLIVIICGCACIQVLSEQQASSKAAFDPLAFFVGHWTGTTQGEPGKGTGVRVYEFVLGNKFLRLHNKSVYPPQEKNPKGEVHEDIGFFSHDKSRQKFVLRQFHQEGFVNEYVEQQRSTDGKTFVFVTEKTPNGWRARETYKIINQDEYSEIFEPAPPQKEFGLYSESHWKREK